MNRVLITTAGRPDDVTEALACAAQKKLGCERIPRNKRSVEKLMTEYSSDILVVGKERCELYRESMSEPFFFHPDTAAFRLKRLVKGELEPLVEACLLTRGSTFLDCTLGLATDSIVASYAVGPEGSVKGIEADPIVAYITANGLVQFEPKYQELKDAMRRISVIHDSAPRYLAESPDRSWDVIYMDPMFSKTITESSSFAPLRQVGVQGSLTEEWISEAIRVARKRVVVKAHYSDPVFETFGFTRIRRPNTKFHFGFIEK